MPKYCKSSTGCVVQNPSPYVEAQCEPVTVLPTADWQRLVEILQNIEIISTSDNDGWDEAQEIIAKVGGRQ